MSVLRENGSAAVQLVRNDIYDWLNHNVKGPWTSYIKLVGSTAVVGEGKDFDVAVHIGGLTQDQYDALRDFLVNELDYSSDGSSAGWEGSFESMKAEEVNILLYNDLGTYLQLCRAHSLCVHLHNLYGICSSKQTRVDIYRHVMGDCLVSTNDEPTSP